MYKHAWKINGVHTIEAFHWKLSSSVWHIHVHREPKLSGYLITPNARIKCFSCIVGNLWLCKIRTPIPTEEDNTVPLHNIAWIWKKEDLKWLSYQFLKVALRTLRCFRSSDHIDWDVQLPINSTSLIRFFTIKELRTTNVYIKLRFRTFIISCQIRH